MSTNNYSNISADAEWLGGDLGVLPRIRSTVDPITAQTRQEAYRTMQKFAERMRMRDASDRIQS